MGRVPDHACRKGLGDPEHIHVDALQVAVMGRILHCELLVAPFNLEDDPPVSLVRAQKMVAKKVMPFQVLGDVAIKRGIVELFAHLLADGPISGIPLSPVDRI